MSCTTFNANGRSDCIDYLKETRAAIILTGDDTYTQDELNNLATMKTILAEETSGIVVEFNGTETTDAELIEETSGFGIKTITGENAPDLMGYVRTNSCDFTDMLDTFDGGNYRVLLYNAGKRVVSTRAANKQKGFNTQVWAKAKGAIGSDSQNQQYAIKFNFLDEFEWRQTTVTKVSYSLFDLYNLIPTALGAPYSVELDASGEASFPIYLRCVENSEQSETFTAVVLAKNVTGEIPTAVPTYNATTEQYDLVVTRDGAAVPIYGDVFSIRIEKDTSGTKEKVSNIIECTVIG